MKPPFHIFIYLGLPGRPGDHVRDRTIFVTGATGKQGSAAVRHLLEAGYRVRGLTRELDKPEALRLVDLGAELVEGDLDDPAQVRRDIEGSYGAFAVLTWAEEGPAGERRQGRNLADAAKDAGVEHFLYSSVGGADRGTGIPHFESKWANERYMRKLGLPLSVLRPAYFMENLNGPGFRKSIPAGRILMALDPDKPLQMISVEDIGFIAAIMLDNPQDWMGRSLEIAGDSLTMPEVAEKISSYVGHRVEYIAQPLDELEEYPERLAMMRWLNQSGYRADIEAIRGMHPSLMTLDRWLQNGHLRIMREEVSLPGT